MRTRIVLVSVLGFVVILLLWNFVFFAPAGRDLDHAKKQKDQAEQTGAGLDARLRTLRKISVQAPEQKAHLEKLNALVPPTADLEGFIRSAVDLEQQSGVDWVSVEPALPAPGASATQIKMQVIVSGGFFQVLDYLNRLETLSRLVVVDGINITTGSGATGSTSGTTPTTTGPTGGAPLLTVTLNARMFTQAAPAAGTTSGPGARTTPRTVPSTTSTTGAK